MRTSLELQHALFENIKNALPANMKLVDAVSRALNIGVNSVYRRLRGETVLSIQEFVSLATAFNIPMEHVLGSQNSYGKLIFDRNPFISNMEGIRMYLAQTLKQLELMQSVQTAHIYYGARDLPIFYFFGHKELGAFKIYVWLKSTQQGDEDREHIFDASAIPSSIMKLGEKLTEAYSHLPCTEIWTERTLTNVLKQVDYYYNSGMLSVTDATVICQQLEDLMEQVHLNARKGYKKDESTKYQLYFSDFLLMENSVLAVLPDRKISFVPYAGINFMQTQHRDFCDEIERWFKLQIRKSSLASRVSGKECNMFFSRAIKRVRRLTDLISSEMGIFD